MCNVKEDRNNKHKSEATKERKEVYLKKKKTYAKYIEKDNNNGDRGLRSDNPYRDCLELAVMFECLILWMCVFFYEANNKHRVEYEIITQR